MPKPQTPVEIAAKDWTKKRGRGRPRKNKPVTVKRVKKVKATPNPAAQALGRERWKGVPPNERKAHSEYMYAQRKRKKIKRVK